MAKKKTNDILEDVKIEETKPEVKETTPEVKAPEIPEVKDEDSLTLRFGNGGWCEELQTSYRPGIRTCKTKKEYDALKKFALDDKRFK